MNWKYQLDAKGYLYSSKSKYLKLVPDQYNNTTRIGNNTTKITCLKPMNLGCTVNSMLDTITEMDHLTLKTQKKNLERYLGNTNWPQQ